MDKEKSTTARDAARQYAQNRAAGARRKTRARSAVPPSVVFEQATANSKGGSGRRALPGATRRRARSLLWISQLTRTKANVNLERLERFEGGVASACAPLRCSAAPLLRCSAAPLLRCAAAPLCRCAAARRCRICRGRRATRYTSPSRMRCVGGAGLPLLHQVLCTHHHARCAKNGDSAGVSYIVRLD